MDTNDYSPKIPLRHRKGGYRQWGAKKLCRDHFIGQSLGDTIIDGYAAYTANMVCANLADDHPTGVKKGEGQIAYYTAIMISM